jgi:hypothetical protein
MIDNDIFIYGIDAFLLTFRKLFFYNSNIQQLRQILCLIRNETNRLTSTYYLLVKIVPLLWRFIYLYTFYISIIYFYTKIHDLIYVQLLISFNYEQKKNILKQAYNSLWRKTHDTPLSGKQKLLQTIVTGMLHSWDRQTLKKAMK